MSGIYNELGYNRLHLTLRGNNRIHRGNYSRLRSIMHYIHNRLFRVTLELQQALANPASHSRAGTKVIS